MFLNNGLQVSTVDPLGATQYNTKFSQTTGGRIVFSEGTWSANGAFYFQTGRDGTSTEIGASDLGVDVSYHGIDKIKLTGGLEFISGTSQTDPAVTKNHSFNPLYGTNHKFNGFMDYFYVGNHLNSVGLNDFFFKFLFKEKKHSAGINAHFFISNEKIINSAEFASSGNILVMDKYLGTEIDFTYIYIPSRDISVHFGYSQMFGTGSMVEIRQGNKNATSNWFYLMLKYKPDFLRKDD